MPGIGYFYGGILHPAIVPSHLVALVALGLLVGQRGLTAMRLSYPCFLMALVTGLILAGFSPAAPANAETALLVIAGCCGLVVALRLAVHPALLALATLLTAFVVGADSGVADLDRRETFGAMLGAGVGACIVFIVAAGLAEMPRRDWQRILIRVVGSWCAASAALVLALALR
jgi:urease accessory protein